MPGRRVAGSQAATFGSVVWFCYPAAWWCCFSCQINAALIERARAGVEARALHDASGGAMSQDYLRDLPQTVWFDGEDHGQSPFTAIVVPQATIVVVF